MTAVARWYLAVVARALRFVPPLLGAAVFAVAVFSTAPQTLTSVTATTAVAVFALSVWAAMAAGSAMAAGWRDIVQVGAGPTRAWLGEALAVWLLTGAIAAALLGSAVIVTRPLPSMASVVVALLAVLAAAGAGSLVALFVASFAMGSAARFVLALGLVSVTLARPAIAAAGWPAAVAAAILPPVMALAQGLDTDVSSAPVRCLPVIAVTLVWVAVAGLGVALLRRRSGPAGDRRP